MAGTIAAGFGSFRLNGVRITEEEFGRGSYAVVLRLEYRGLKCAGKKLYPVLYEQGAGETVRRFEEECQLLARMRHPNIVQFIGVYFEEGSRVPILVMEFLPTTLARCIDTYGVLPKEISYSILHDVALGLYHLHSQTPSTIHRDLSANNVLLTSNMTAKISDLGVARILNLTPQQMSCMTQAPGTPAYMPPEAMRANPRYDTRIDEFSYGILMIHVLCGRWPLPLCEPVRLDPHNPDQLIPASEADRREEYLQDIGNAHPLMDLILRCVSNNPARRARAAEIVQRMSDMIRQFPPSFANRVEMLQRIETEASEKQTLIITNQSLVAEVEQHQAEVERVCTEMTAKLNAQDTAAQEEIERSKLAHSLEIEQTRLQLAELQTHSEALQIEWKSQIETLQARMKSENETYHIKLRAQSEASKALSSELETLETEITRVRRANRELQATVAAKSMEISTKEAAVVTNDATLAQKESEMDSKNAVLDRQSSTIRGLNKQLTRVREFLSRQKLQDTAAHTELSLLSQGGEGSVPTGGAQDEQDTEAKNMVDSECHTVQLTEAKVQETVERWVSEGHSLSIVAVGKTGAGKSTLLNSLIGHPVAKVGSGLLAGTTEVAEYQETISGIEVRLFETPGLADPLVMATSETLNMIAKKCQHIDLLLFAIPMTQTRMSRDDVEAIKNITDAFGKDVWKNAVIALTFANKLQLPIKNQEQDPRKYFKERFSEWVELVHKVLKIESGAGLEENPMIAESVPVVPTGHEECGLPDREDWFSAFWTAAFIQVNSKAQPALLIINQERFMSEGESASLDAQRLSPEKRPIIVNRRTSTETMGLKSEVTKSVVAAGSGTLIGAAVGSLIGLIGGPLGAAAGAATGAQVGAGIGSSFAFAYYIGDAILKQFRL